MQLRVVELVTSLQPDGGQVVLPLHARDGQIVTPLQPNAFEAPLVVKLLATLCDGVAVHSNSSGHVLRPLVAAFLHRGHV